VGSSTSPCGTPTTNTVSTTRATIVCATTRLYTLCSTYSCSDSRFTTSVHSSSVGSTRVFLMWFFASQLGVDNCVFRLYSSSIFCKP